MTKEKESDTLIRRKAKMAELKKQNINLFPNDFKVTHTVKEIKDQIAACTPENIENLRSFATAGRIIAINRFGKSAFVRFRDRSGQLQAYIRKDRVGDESYGLFKQVDIGDFVGLTGGMFQTKTEEWTLLADQLKLVSKATRPLPEKFHGLRDPEKRYRQRYIDLVMNAEIRDIFLIRSQSIKAMREFLTAQDFLEVETPMMQPLPGGAEATPFVTHHKALGIDLFLRIAPELYLKRLVVGGFERVFEINRNFRNEGVSTQHNPEFTMLEFYQAYANFKGLMEMTEEMLRHVARAVLGNTEIIYQGHTIDLGAKWRRMTLASAPTQLGGIEAKHLKNVEALLEIAASHGIHVTQTSRIGKVMMKLFDALVEPQLIQPTFITAYPVEVSPLSRRSDTNPELVDRFELFMGGYEIANGFSELNDPEDQRDRFRQQMAERAAGNTEAHVMDEDYIEALEYGMPPTAGEGLGIDRLVMILTNSASIREVILFPHMRPRAD